MGPESWILKEVGLHWQRNGGMQGLRQKPEFRVLALPWEEGRDEEQDGRGTGYPG